ncbi:MAG: hypothetical protein QME66_13805 [Candidatus Eisenbacteria bacterium]|nr:hypothetical protein [Candidatus Eisenbacteria bacterium]
MKPLEGLKDRLVPGLTRMMSLPRRQRLVALAWAAPSFLILDGGIAVLAVALTWANGVLWAGNISLPMKATLAISELVLAIGLIFPLYLQMAFLHWALTGQWLRTWADVRDWSLRP